jgi:molybdate transport repressor ModE-like protein
VSQQSFRRFPESPRGDGPFDPREPPARSVLRTAVPGDPVQPLRRWPGIELRHLEALSVVAEEGSFRRAARRLGYTQSAISQQIAALERAIGHPVLERPSRGRPLALTDVGSRLRRLYDTVEQAMTAARADVAAAAAGAGKVVRIGIAFSLPHLAEAVVAARARNPRVLVEVVRGAEDERLVRLVESGALDFAVVRGPASLEGISVREAASCSYVLAIPASSPLARTKSRLGLCDVAQYARVGTADGTAYTGDSQTAIVAADAEMALELVGAGAGASVLPGILATTAPASVAVRPLRDILPPFQIAIAAAAELSPSSAQISELVAAAVAGWPGETGTNATTPA